MVRSAAAQRREKVATTEGAGCVTPSSRWCVSDPLARFARVSPSRGGDYACNMRALFSPSLRGRAAEGGRGAATHRLVLGLGNRPEGRGERSQRQIPSPRPSAVATFLCRAVAAALCFCGSVLAQNSDSLFQMHCANCHRTANSVAAPLPETLRQMSWQSILAALETGKMKGVGDALTP